MESRKERRAKIAARRAEAVAKALHRNTGTTAPTKTAPAKQAPAKKASTTPNTSRKAKK